MKEVRKGEAQAGDIIKVRESVFDESIGSRKWYINFTKRTNFYIIVYISNNGNAIVKSHKNPCRNINIFLDSTIQAVYRR